MTGRESRIAARDLSNWTPTELARAVADDGALAAQALEELRQRALHAPYPFKRKGTM